MERKWIIVAFGDIRGFGAWTRRAANSLEVRQALIRRFYAELETFVRSTDHYVKYIGDGMMILKELPEKGHRCVAARDFLRNVMSLTRELLIVVKECEWPPPKGFRMRVVVGHVDKLEIIDGKDPDRKRLISEYVGYGVNLAQRLLEVFPETEFICHESVVAILGAKKKAFKIKRLSLPKKLPSGVDSEDIAELRSFQL